MTIIISPDNPHYREYAALREQRRDISKRMYETLRLMSELQGVSLAWEKFGILHGVNRKGDRDDYRHYSAVKMRINENLDRFGYIVLTLQRNYADLTQKMEALVRSEEKGVQ